LASHTVHVTSEAKARPIITAFTTMSALRNIPHGDRLCGNNGFGPWAKAGCDNSASADDRPPITGIGRRQILPLACFLLL